MDERIDAVRQAVAAEDWRGASLSWNDYAAALQRSILNGTCNAERMTEARQLLDWTKRSVLCLRAQTQDQLNGLHAVRQYSPSEDSAPRLFLTVL